MVVSFLRRFPPVIMVLLAVTVAASLYAAIDARREGDLYARLALIPADVWHGEVWRLVSWPVVDNNPILLVVTCVMLYGFGGELAMVWGTRRFLSYVVAIVTVTGALTCVVALAVPAAWDHPQLGGFALGNALMVAWALQFPERSVQLHSLLEARGTVLAYGTVAMSAFYAMLYGVVDSIPELIAGGAGLALAARWLVPIVMADHVAGGDDADA